MVDVSQSSANRGLGLLRVVRVKLGSVWLQLRRGKKKAPRSLQQNSVTVKLETPVCDRQAEDAAALAVADNEGMTDLAAESESVSWK